jgi:hypothetical protein
MYLDPGASMSRVVEVSNVDSPDSHADERDDLGELFTKLVKFLLQGSLDLLCFTHLSTDLACNYKFDIKLQKIKNYY